MDGHGISRFRFLCVVSDYKTRYIVLDIHNMPFSNSIFGLHRFIHSTHQKRFVFQFVVTPCLCGGFYFRFGMVVDTLGLEENGVVNMAPEMCHRITTVPLARHQL
jgi:hypothetical protein